MFKPSPNPPQSGHKSRVQAQEEKKLDDAATRALDYYLNPKPASPPEPDSTKLFIVAPHIDTETLLANASEDLLSISAFAANLADDLDGPRRSMALGLSRMADGVRLMVEGTLDHIEFREYQAKP